MSELLPTGANAAVRATEVAIDLESVPADDTVAGTPRQGLAELGTIGDCEAGIWELREGVTTDTEVDELFVVLSGGATIELLGGPGIEAGTVFEVTAGDVMRLVAGTRTKWTVPDHIRKVYLSEQ